MHIAAEVPRGGIHGGVETQMKWGKGGLIFVVLLSMAAAATGGFSFSRPVEACGSCGLQPGWAVDHLQDCANVGALPVDFQDANGNHVGFECVQLPDANGNCVVGSYQGIDQPGPTEPVCILDGPPDEGNGSGGGTPVPECQSGETPFLILSDTSDNIWGPNADGTWCLSTDANGLPIGIGSICPENEPVTLGSIMDGFQMAQCQPVPTVTPVDPGNASGTGTNGDKTDDPGCKPGEILVGDGMGGLTCGTPDTSNDGGNSSAATDNGSVSNADSGSADSGESIGSVGANTVTLLPVTGVGYGYQPPANPVTIRFLERQVWLFGLFAGSILMLLVLSIMEISRRHNGSD